MKFTQFLVKIVGREKHKTTRHYRAELKLKQPNNSHKCNTRLNLLTVTFLAILKRIETNSF